MTRFKLKALAKTFTILLGPWVLSDYVYELVYYIGALLLSPF